MRRTKHAAGVVSLLYCALLLVGCNKTEGLMYQTPVIISDEPNHWSTQNQKINPHEFKFRVGDTHTVFEQALTDRVYRDHLQDEIMALSDRVTERHLAAVMETADFWNFGWGTATTVLGAVGAVAGPAAPAYSAAAGGTNAIRTLGQESFWKKAFADAITSAIRAERRLEAVRIREYRLDHDVDSYNVSNAVADAIQYHQLGSFYHGIELVRRDTEKASSERNDLAADAKPLPPAREDLPDLEAADDKLTDLYKEHAAAGADAAKQAAAIAKGKKILDKIDRKHNKTGVDILDELRAQLRNLPSASPSHRKKVLGAFKE
jgi:hypothetical protein